MSDNGPEWHGGSDAEYRRYKKARAEWARLIRDAGSDAERSEEEAIERAAQKGDQDFEQGIENLIGYTAQDIREVYGSLSRDEIRSMTPAEREAFEALQRADRTWFFKASAQRDAQKKIKRARGAVKKRIKKKKGCLDCAVVALVGGLVAAFEVYVVASGVTEAVAAVTGR